MKREHEKEYTSEISFPLGGLGTGSIGIAGNGSLVDWEINNRPNRESINCFSNFAIKAEDDEKVLDYRILQGDIYKDFMGSMHSGNHSWGYGHGPNRGTLAGVKHFSDVSFKGEFPIATLSFKDECFPGLVTMEAFSPFIPSNDFDSSIPSAFFSFFVKNTTNKTLNYTIAFSVANPLKRPGINEYINDNTGDISKIVMHSKTKAKSSFNYGNVTIATDNPDFSYQESWHQGGWFDNLTMFVNDFKTYGKMKNRTSTKRMFSNPVISTITATVKVEPGEQKQIRFNLSWFVPNYYKYWIGTLPTKLPKWKNYYAKMFDSSMEVAEYAFQNWDKLYSDTNLFKDALHSSSLPDCFVDAIQGNIATLKTTTTLRLTNGDFFGWEGVNKSKGSCEGTCQHVWNYAYAMPFLFPYLERNIRENEYKYSYKKTGKLNFRMMLPLGNINHFFRACVDGQFGTVMKFYREWKICGDGKWLETHWSKIKKSIEYAWSEKNPDKWDIDKTGVLFGRQHHTLDVEAYGAYAWLTGFYHGALLAGAEMAGYVGDMKAKSEYLELYEKGHKWLEDNTFNGEYYIQKIDVKDRTLLDKYGDSKNILLNMVGGYWDKELEEIKYQFGEGCYIDQVVADWHADLMGLQNIFDQDNRRTALESIYKYNLKSAREIDNPCRVYITNDEVGVMNCTWKDKASKPKIPVPYTEEVFTGFEYAFACNLLQVGLEEEAINVVTQARKRYNGKNRNPWAEIECGASYARAMASYSLLLGYSGFKYDMTKNMIGFKPLKWGNYFWSIDGAWGTVAYNSGSLSISVLYGGIYFNHIVHPFGEVSSVTVNDTSVEFTAHQADSIKLDVHMCASDVLHIMSD